MGSPERIMDAHTTLTYGVDSGLKRVPTVISDARPAREANAATPQGAMRMCSSAAAWCAAHDLQEERDAGLLEAEGFDELPRVRHVGHVVGGHHRSVRRFFVAEENRLDAIGARAESWSAL